MSFALIPRLLSLGLVAFLWANSALHADPIEESSIWVAERSSSPTELAVRLRPLTRRDWHGSNLLRLPETRKLRGREWHPEWSWLVSRDSLLERWDGPMVHLPEVASLRVPDLQAELRNARRAAMDTDDLLVEFVIRNVSDRDIVIAERWNTWGSDQWEIELRDGSGSVRVLVNQQMDWFANFPSTVAIAVCSEHVTECYLESPAVHRKGRSAPNDAFSEESRSPTPWRFPVHLRGRFGTEGSTDFGSQDSGWTGLTPNWSGMIWSDEITVER